MADTPKHGSTSQADLSKPGARSRMEGEISCGKRAAREGQVPTESLASLRNSLPLSTCSWGRLVVHCLRKMSGGTGRLIGFRTSGIAPGDFRLALMVRCTAGSMQCTLQVCHGLLHWQCQCPTRACFRQPLHQTPLMPWGSRNCMWLVSMVARQLGQVSILDEYSTTGV